MHKILIITGGSKGIGKALLTKYADNDFHVFSIARTKSSHLKNTTHLVADLSNPINANTAINSIFQKIELKKVKNITLIHNAGSLGTISPIENNSIESIQKTVQLNLTSPLLITSLFIKKLLATNCAKKIINISSGAAVKPYEGWSIYCGTKAGLDMATRTIAKEQETYTYPVKTNAIYPGVVATAMQEQIRNTSEKDFKNVQRFIDLKKENKLFSPEFVASKIFEIDTNNLLKNGEIVDLRNI